MVCSKASLLLSSKYLSVSDGGLKKEATTLVRGVVPVAAESYRRSNPTVNTTRSSNSGLKALPKIQTFNRRHTSNRRGDYLIISSVLPEARICPPQATHFTQPAWPRSTNFGTNR